MKYLLLFCIFSCSHIICAQDKEPMEAPYHEIPEYPADYSSGNILSRMIDGLGYRYHWATKDLKEDDLTYKPSDDGKSTFETLQHMYSLSRTILNGCLNEVNMRPSPPVELDFEELRMKTLENFMTASKACLNKSSADVAELKVSFQRGENKNTFEFWHMINGPIADALYHTGQIVAFRRASGNPTSQGVNVFMGKNKE